jgi:hypothetical protein
MCDCVLVGVGPLLMHLREEVSTKVSGGTFGWMCCRWDNHQSQSLGAFCVVKVLLRSFRKFNLERSKDGSQHR